LRPRRKSKLNEGFALRELSAASAVLLTVSAVAYLYAYIVYRSRFFLLMASAWLLNILYLVVESLPVSLPASVEYYSACETAAVVPYVLSLPSAFLVLAASRNVFPEEKRATFLRSTETQVFVASVLSSLTLWLTEIPPESISFLVVVGPGVVLSFWGLVKIGLYLSRMECLGFLSFLRNEDLRGEVLASTNFSETQPLVDARSERLLGMSRYLMMWSFIVYGTLQLAYFLRLFLLDDSWFAVPYYLGFLCKSVNLVGLALLLFVDVTFVNRVVHAKNLWADLGFIYAAVEHDIRTPLSTLRRQVRLLEQRIKSSGRPAELPAQKIRLLKGQISRIQAVADLVGAVRGQSEQGLLENGQQSNLVHVARAAVKEIRSQTREPHIRILLLDGPAVLHITGQKNRILQAVTNIVRNSVEAVRRTQKERRPLVEVRCYLEGGTGERVVQVEDNGPGISAELLRTVTLPGVSTKTGKNENRGIGLYISKRVVESYGGALLISSESEFGTTVRLVFPEPGDSRK